MDTIKNGGLDGSCGMRPLSGRSEMDWIPTRPIPTPVFPHRSKPFEVLGCHIESQAVVVLALPGWSGRILADSSTVILVQTFLLS